MIQPPAAWIPLPEYWLAPAEHEQRLAGALHLLPPDPAANAISRFLRQHRKPAEVPSPVIPASTYGRTAQQQTLAPALRSAPAAVAQSVPEQPPSVLPVP